MKKLLLAASAIVLTSVTIDLADAHDQAGRFVRDRDTVSRFATLPDGVRFPEGIAANPSTGDIFVGTFDFGSPNKVLRFSRHGQLSAMRDFGATPLLGLGFDAGHRKLYILNFGASKLQRLPANFDASTPIEDVAAFPSIGAPAPRSAGNPDGSTDTITFGSNSFP